MSILLQIPGVGSTSDLVTIITYAIFFLFIVYGQQIQYYSIASGVGRSVDRLRTMAENAKHDAVNYLWDGKPTEAGTKQFSRMVDYVSIMPESMDPAGLVSKTELVTRTQDARIREEIKDIISDGSSIKVSVGENLVEITGSLSQIHRVARHYYLDGRKHRSYFELIQIQAALPQLLDQADSMVKAMESFEKGIPVGDGLGPLVASGLMAGSPSRVVAKDTVYVEREFRGRHLGIIKAQGPMGYVGEPDVALREVISSMPVKPKIIVMADATLKLEGDRTGDIEEGIGAAIGGIGTEKFRIEELATKESIPIYAILVNESNMEAITCMRKEIADATGGVLNALTGLIDRKTQVGDSVVFIGVGNTLGIAQ